MRFRLRSIAPLLASLAGAALGCYKPNITDWGLKCAIDGGTKACPEDFKCDVASQRCYQNPDAAHDRPTDIDATDTRDAETGEPPPICFDARPSCTPGSGICDPFCRTGC